MDRYVGRSLTGRAYHVLPVERPAGAGPHDRFWDTRLIATLCGRVIEAHPVADTYADGTPVPVCRACARVEARS